MNTEEASKIIFTYTCAGVTFSCSVRAGGLIVLKRDSNTSAFLWILRNSWEHLFEEHLRTAASVLLNIKLLIKYWVSADFFLIKNITWNGFYCEGFVDLLRIYFLLIQSRSFAIVWNTNFIIFSFRTRFISRGNFLKGTCRSFP